MTHGGGVVFKLTSEGPRYLLVEASGTRGRWVFPQGHIEDGETGAIDALDLGKSRRVLRSADRLSSAAALLALPAGMLVSLAMRALLRPLEGLVSGDHDATLPPGEDRLRLLIGGAEWIRRTDYLGSPIRIAGALAVLLPVHAIATAGSVFALVSAFGLSALSAVAWWRLERRRGGVLAAVGGSRA